MPKQMANPKPIVPAIRETPEVETPEPPVTPKVTPVPPVQAPPAPKAPPTPTVFVSLCMQCQRQCKSTLMVVSMCGRFAKKLQ